MNNLAQKYDLQVPRYTNFPTAPHFSDAVDAGRQGAWLGGLASDVPVSPYFHIPFCDTLC